MRYHASPSLRPVAPAHPSQRPPLDETRGDYAIRFAHDQSDLDACYRLRYTVFNLELGEGLAGSERTQLDVDKFDAQCHHLMVIHESSGTVIGTYRIQTAAMADAGLGFYSAQEFDLASMPDEMTAGSIELGRACISREHRNRVVLFLLWRGLMAHLLWNKKRYLFGCSSLTSQTASDGLWAFEHLERKGLVQRDWFCATRPGFECTATDFSTNAEDFPIPSLFATYLRHGAHVCGGPALDREFGTIDFLTLIDKQEFDSRLAALFALGLPER
ncbi:MAG: GNAT family N-acyltransferase [bacterium]|nr:GNAT family N-acetyltransferase [Planctomycetota bacterium]HIL53184.1 GNAT family N-acetyltransferase [Planctomycetota bacterium]